MKKYTTLYFDIDNTLLDFYASETHAVKKVFEKHGLPSDNGTVALYSAINKSYWEKYEKGIMKRDDILVARFKETLEKLGAADNPAAVNADYFHELSACHFKMPFAREILEYLKGTGYRIFATTNGVAKTQYKRISESGLSEFFDGIFVSEEVGSQKPSREYFDFVTANTPEKDKSRILIIGDSMTSDIKGGINAGIDTCWLDAFGEEKLFSPTYTVKELSELKKIL